MAPWMPVLAGVIGVVLGWPLSHHAAMLLHGSRRLGWPVRAGAMLATGALFAWVTALIGLRWELPAYLYLAAIAVVLSIVDLAEKRLPNRVVYPALVVVPALLAIAAALTGSWLSLLGAVFGAVGLFVFYFVLALVSPAGIGMGDVKLAAVLGFALGYLGWTPLLVGSMAGFIVGGLVSVIALATRRVTLRSSIPFGPSMLAGAFVALLLS
jgi:leader peptidase (prepilin peptidase) / N-methyltransferase